MKTHTQEELNNMDKTMPRTEREFLKDKLESGEDTE